LSRKKKTRREREGKNTEETGGHKIYDGKKVKYKIPAAALGRFARALF